MLQLKIERGPLPPARNVDILAKYNRLTRSRIPLEEFVNWVQRSPAGPAWHATLNTADGRLVGHASIFPFLARYSDKPLTPAKSEYSFLLEDFRTARVQGFENSALPPFMILVGELLKVGDAEGWAPIFASTAEKNYAFTQRLGLLPTEYKVRECLFVMRPVSAAKFTPNLAIHQRAALFCAGLSHKSVWAATRTAVRRSNSIHRVGVDREISDPELSRIAFFEDSASLNWRYISGQYVRFSSNALTNDFVIAKKGSGDRYLRVCQWRLQSSDPLRSYLLELLREAYREKALGVRWALYEKDDATSRAILKHARRLGFLTIERPRVVMVHKKDPEFLIPAAWKMNDSLFSFDP